MDDFSAPEGISEVEKEISPPAATPEQHDENVPTRHDDDLNEARKIEAAFNTQERTDELKQKAHDEGKELAQRSQETPKPTPQPVPEVPKPVVSIENTEGFGPQPQLQSIQELPKPITSDEKNTESEAPQTQPKPQVPPQSGSRLANIASAFQQERARLRTVNREVKKAV